ncbi:MAG: hypothetical protein IJI41_08485 [Anaerolineaceae bacterium]|nr:hypothetical protein [Anaerolineaceae bacterium]
MDSYTEKLESRAAELYEYEALEKLPQIIASFRGHGTALSLFLNEHGYPADQNDTVASKAEFLKQKFKQAGISSSKARNAQKWLSEANAFERETGFRIAFALGLTIEETDEFFRTVLLDRSFDCHTIEEAIYYYCIYHGKGYPSAESLIAAAPQAGKTAVPSEGDVLYTKNIISYLRNCSSDEALLQYFRENLSQFGYNQVKAKEFIGHLWKQISEPDVLAELERKYFPQYEKGDNPAIENSTWGIYLQILGLSFDVERIEADRTIKPILDNPTFMHQFAADNYPTRQSIDKLLRGESVKHDLTRKTLILLVFYRFWMSVALSHRERKTYEASEHDRERCLDELDQYLLDAGFPEIYAGNPYDWIFLWAAGREAPLIAFRYYWRLLSAEFSEKKIDE